MRVKSTYPENRPKADIDVLQAWDKANVPTVKIPPLKLLNKKVVKTDGAVPKQKFSFENNLWDIFDKIEYHFDCKIDQTVKQTQKFLKVKHWHVQAVDTGDMRPAFPPMRASEKQIFITAFNSDTNGKAHAKEFPAPTASHADFGSWMKNTYTFVYTGHGEVVCGVCGRPYKCENGDGSDAQFGTWTVCSMDSTHSSPVSTHCIGSPPPDFWDVVKQVCLPINFFSAQQVADQSICESTPKYLMFSVCCGGAFEPSLYNAYLGRGTKYCVGFKKSTRCDWARDYARDFFDAWVNTHKCDPAKIPVVFNGMPPHWIPKLLPVLFGGGADADSGASVRAAGGAGI